MYPDFQYLISKLLGVDAPQWFSLFKTFGMFVALGFLGGAYVLVKDLQRKEKLGYLKYTIKTKTVGLPASQADLFTSGFIGFLLGFKMGGLLLNWQIVGQNPMSYVFSTEGNFIIGLLLAAVMAYLKYAEKKKEQLPEPKEVQYAVYPHHHISEFVVAAMVAGIAGAKLFNAFETWDDFIKNPIQNLISSSGLTFYGGLITAAVTIAIYAKKNNISIIHLADSFAPAMMLAYGIGRLGCQFAGDGDWGIFNSAYITDATGHLIQTAPNNFLNALHHSPEYLTSLSNQFGNANLIPHVYQPAPNWLPDWLFAMNYPNNVNNEGVLLAGSVGNYNAVLPVGVFPTPLYEAVVCMLLFFVLWKLRSKMKYGLHLSGIYLILNGMERFFVEKIRVNYKYDWGFVHPTQAEIIACFLMLFGLSLLIFTRKKLTPIT